MIATGASPDSSLANSVETVFVLCRFEFGVSPVLGAFDLKALQDASRVVGWDSSSEQNGSTKQMKGVQTK